jgi:hypothetical protein
VKLSVCNLEDVAKVSLGFKSLQNQFFYVSRAEIKRYSIEKRFLQPIFQLGDLDADKYKQFVKPVQWVFYCKDKEADLRNTGALGYIRAMEKVPASEKKQGGKPQTIRQALQAQTSAGGIWYAPKAQMHRVNIWLRKAFNTIYSPFIFDPGEAVDQRCNYVLPLDNIDWKELAALLTSSLFALSAESLGAASMGAGVLELATTKIQELRIVDPRGLKDSSARSDLAALSDAVWTKTKPVNWEQADRPPHEVQELDKWLLQGMGTGVTLDRLYSDLVRTMNVRLTVARDKDKQVKKHHQIDIATVAGGIAESVRPLLESRSFPDSFVEPGSALEPLDFAKAGRLELESQPMMEQATLVVKSGPETLFEAQLQRNVAQVIIKALLLGRRKFSYPINESAATAALREFSRWFPKVLKKIADGCGMSAVGTSYEERVYLAVLEILRLDPNILGSEFFGNVTIQR